MANTRLTGIQSFRNLTDVEFFIHEGEEDALPGWIAENLKKICESLQGLVVRGRIVIVT